MSQDVLDRFHPVVASWFRARFPGGPTEAQRLAWPSLLDGRSTLIAAPTGSGKTLAAFLAAIDALVRRGLAGRLEDAVEVVYVSPLKALSNDIRLNLEEPLAGIRDRLPAGATGAPGMIRALVRTGDTPAGERAAMLRRPPHILVTTPESLYILLTAPRSRNLLRGVRSVIVDEIHAVIDDKRGSHLSLSLERLEALASEGGGPPPLRIGCSATQRPIENAARFLVGAARVGPDGVPDCAIVDTGHARALDLALEIPRSPLQAVMSNEAWEEVYDRLAGLIRAHRTTLVFVNTRRLAERLCRQLGERLGPDRVAAHHGSLARPRRLDAEKRLKSGNLQALVATASLELGIDIGAVDLVCQIGSTRSIAVLLQRVGRSGHSVGGFPKGRLFPLTVDELVECAALLDCVGRGELDRLSVPRAPLDILAQQIVAAVACEDWRADDLFARVRRAWPYRDLARSDFDAVLLMLAEGFSLRRGRRAAFLHHDPHDGRLRARKGARLAAITSGGAIPDTADYEVLLEPEGTTIGSVNEDFAIESMAGDIFQLGNASWKIRRVEPGRVRVEDARGQPPGIPFWTGEAPARTDELSFAVSRLREEIGRRLDAGASPGEVRADLLRLPGLPDGAAEQIVAHLDDSRRALGAIPTQGTLVLERFFDESGGMQLVLHAPFGRRINFAWGLALRKRFCRSFNIELQAAATENAIVLSLGPSHSFPLEEVFRYLTAAAVRDVVVQALLVAPMFGVRWRWNATRSLAILRFRGGRRVAPQILRMQAEDLVAAVFPDQIACAENLAGERRIPDHPLVRQTIDDCLEEAMDVPGLEVVLADIAASRKRLVVRDTPEPSPLAREVLTARPYAFLDDAPLEERRTQAVASRRWIDRATANDLGTLDQAAIDRVRREAWPEAATADEMEDALEILGFVTGPEAGAGWDPLLRELAAAGRAAILRLRDEADPSSNRRVWVSRARLAQALAAFPGSIAEGAAVAAPASSEPGETALAEILRGRLEGLGPVGAAALASSCGLSPGTIDVALLRLEAEGFVLRGRFTPGGTATEWCARGLLARIHRATLTRLRAEIEPVSAADYLRFLFSWQRVTQDERGDGPRALEDVLGILEGFEAPAGAWETDILPARLRRYDPAWLDGLCLSGRIVWARLNPPRPAADGGRGAAPLRSTPIALLRREHLPVWSQLAGPGTDSPVLSTEAGAVLDVLGTRGALFFDEIRGLTRLLPARVERALAELVARGRIASDGFAGLRGLLAPGGRRRSRRLPGGTDGAGRWSSPWSAGASPGREALLETAASVLLRRYGVVCRRLLDREGGMPPWRDLLGVYRRLEARGTVRGGRFVAGLQGEQFALPEGLERLRATRRAGPGGSLIAISAADPLNLVGHLVPGPRLLPLASSRVLYRDGAAIAVLEKGALRHLAEPDPATDGRIRSVILRRSGPQENRASLEGRI